MLTNYNRKANVAGAIWLVCSASLVATVTGNGTNIWDSGNVAAQMVLVVAVLAWFYALGAYAKAKGYSAWWALAGVLSVIGLGILLALPDRQAGEA